MPEMQITVHLIKSSQYSAS